MFLILRYDIQQSGRKSTRCWFNFILNSAAALGPSQRQTQIRVGCLAGKKELTKINFNAAFFFFPFVPHSPMWYEGAIVRRKSQLSAADKPVPVVFWHRKTLCFCQLSVGTKQDEQKADYKKRLGFYSISSFFFFFFDFHRFVSRPSHELQANCHSNTFNPSLIVFYVVATSEETLSRLITLPSC